MSNEQNQKPEDQVQEETANENEAVDESTVEVSLEKLLEEARQKAENNWNEVLRARAEMENQRRRNARDLENAHKHALDKFVTELLPICDSLELGINASKNDEASLESVRDGMDMTLKMLLGNIGKLGLEKIEPTGEAFDPEAHQAVSMQPTEGVESNQVVAVMQKGYRFNGRVLRPAMVVVAQ